MDADKTRCEGPRPVFLVLMIVLLLTLVGAVQVTDDISLVPNERKTFEQTKELRKERQ